MSASLAQISVDQKGEAAGRYWGAIIMANEFKKNICGKDINLASKWTNVAGAKQEIINSFPTSMHQEINSVFTTEYEASARARFEKMWSKVDPNKCAESQAIFYNIFDAAVTQWQNIKSQPIK